MKIVIKSIPHKNQRYSTVGDWFYKGKGKSRVLYILVSEMPDRRMAQAVAIHELFEALVCAHNKVSQKSVDLFDMEFEKKRTAGEVPEGAEPGDWPFAPYGKEHTFATAVERIFTGAVDLNWEIYTQAIKKLP